MSGAIVDSDLRGQKAYRVADVLVSRRIPFVFYTGYPKVSLPDRFASIPCFEKPLMQHAAVRELLNWLGRDTEQSMLGAPRFGLRANCVAAIAVDPFSITDGQAHWKGRRAAFWRVRPLAPHPLDLEPARPGAQLYET
jgi:hypothetical protein